MPESRDLHFGACCPRFPDELPFKARLLICRELTGFSPRWFAALLLPYNNRDPFLDRDAGLFYRGFRDIGVDSKFVALGAQEDSEGDVILGSVEQLSSPDWWKQWNLEGVVLYSWGLRKFTPVASAIKRAGVRLVIILDADGYMTPKLWPARYYRNAVDWSEEEKFPLPRIKALARTLKNIFAPSWEGLLEHLQLADLLALPSNMGLQRYRAFLRAVGRPDIAERTRLIPHPVRNWMRFEPAITKSRQVIAVGGWNRRIKNAPLLIKCLDLVMKSAPAYEAVVVGPGEGVLKELVQRCAKDTASRISIAGPFSNESLSRIYQGSRISVCTSFNESFHIATAEALCCGCSFVGAASISSMPYFGSLCGAGTVAAELTPRDFADAILAEINLWESGHRNPSLIAKTWGDQVHCSKVAERVLQEIG